MRLPQELAMLVGSHLNPRDLQMCTTQLCSSGPEFVANLFTNDGTTILLDELVQCCRSSVGVEHAARECIERIVSFVKRRGNVKTIIMRANFRISFFYRGNPSVYSDIHRRLQQCSSLQLNQNQGVTVEWRVVALSIEQVEFLLKTVDVPKAGAGASDPSASSAIRQCVHTLDFSNSKVSDVSALASCQSLHTLLLLNTRVRNVSALASCQSLNTLDLYASRVTNVKALAKCLSLRHLMLDD
jgi:hypothetical protein